VKKQDERGPVTSFTIGVPSLRGALAHPEFHVRRRKGRAKGGAPVVHYIALEMAGIRLPDETGKLVNAIKEMGDAYQFQKQAWIVETELTNTEISEKLVTVLRPNDRLLVMRVHKDWIAANLPQAELDWLSARNYSAVGDPPLAVRPLGVQPHR
jgi:hypothetical protein